MLIKVKYEGFMRFFKKIIQKVVFFACALLSMAPLFGARVLPVPTIGTITLTDAEIKLFLKKSGIDLAFFEAKWMSIAEDVQTQARIQSKMIGGKKSPMPTIETKEAIRFELPEQQLSKIQRLSRWFESKSYNIIDRFISSERWERLCTGLALFTHEATATGAVSVPYEQVSTLFFQSRQVAELCATIRKRLYYCAENFKRNYVQVDGSPIVTINKLLRDLGLRYDTVQEKVNDAKFAASEYGLTRDTLTEITVPKLVEAIIHAIAHYFTPESIAMRLQHDDQTVLDFPLVPLMIERVESADNLTLHIIAAPGLNQEDLVSFLPEDDAEAISWRKKLLCIVLYALQVVPTPNIYNPRLVSISGIAADMFLEPAGYSRATALKILGFSEEQSARVYRKKRNELVLKFHPDKGGSHEKVVEILQAYEVLAKKIK